MCYLAWKKRRNYALKGAQSSNYQLPAEYHIDNAHPCPVTEDCVSMTSTQRLHFLHFLLRVFLFLIICILQ